MLDDHAEAKKKQQMKMQGDRSYQSVWPADNYGDDDDGDDGEDDGEDADDEDAKRELLCVVDPGKIRKGLCAIRIGHPLITSIFTDKG